MEVHIFSPIRPVIWKQELAYQTPAPIFETLKNIYHIPISHCFKSKTITHCITPFQFLYYLFHTMFTYRTKCKYNTAVVKLYLFSNIRQQNHIFHKMQEYENRLSAYNPDSLFQFFTYTSFSFFVIISISPL